MAKEQLGDGDFAQVASAIPGLGDLIGEAPAEEKGLAGAIGGLAGMMGGSGGQLANMAALAGGFSKLGLSPAMAGKFIPIILSFSQSKGGDQVKNILAGILK